MVTVSKAVTIEVTSAKRQCFYEHISKQQHVHIEVFTLQSESGSLTIQLQVTHQIIASCSLTCTLGQRPQ